MKNIFSRSTQKSTDLHSRDQASTILKLVLVIDLVYIVLHLVLKLTPWLESSSFDLSEDQSHAELFQYIKYLWIIVLLVIMSRSKNQYGYLSWAGLFFYILLDDALMFHERIGKYLAYKFELPGFFGLRPLDIGELTVFLVAGLILLPWVFLFYLRGSRTFRIHSLNFFTFFAAFSFFGLFLDLIHEAIKIKYVYGIISILEDGGEMIIISGFTAYIFWILHRKGKDRTLLIPQAYANPILSFRAPQDLTK